MDTKPKILIIDDDQFLLDMYAIKFSQSDFEVTSVLGPEKALEKLNEGLNPSVILLDIMMPGMNGFELLQKINETGIAEKSVKIILSNRGEQADINKGKELGADGYIIKASTTPTEVISQVKTIMQSASK